MALHGSASPAAHQWFRVTTLAGPLALQNLSSYGLGLVVIAFAGRLGQLELSVVLLASSLFNNTVLCTADCEAALLDGWSMAVKPTSASAGCMFMYGFSSSIETLGGAAVGAGNDALATRALQQAIMTCNAACAIILLGWSFIGTPLALFVTDAAMLGTTSKCLLYMFPALWATGMLECLKRYLAVKDEAVPPMVITAITTLLMPLFCWYFMFHQHLGVVGAALALDMALLLNLALLLGYMAYRHVCPADKADRLRLCWSIDMFIGMWSTVELGTHSSLMLLAEWWSFALVMLMSGRLPNPQVAVAVTGVGNTLGEMLYLFACGFGGAASTLIAQQLGAGQPRAAQGFATAAMWLTAAVQGTSGVLLMMVRFPIGHLFSNSAEVVHGIVAMLPVLSMLVVVEGLTATQGGILRGAAKPHLGALINLPAHWLVGVPAAYVMGLQVGWGAPGLWGGMVGAAAVQMVANAVVIRRFEWEVMAGAAVDEMTSAGVELCSATKAELGACADEATALLSEQD